MLLVDERCLQPNLVGADRIVPVASVAASRDLDASSSTQRAAMEIAAATRLRLCQPLTEPGASLFAIRGIRRRISHAGGGRRRIRHAPPIFRVHMPASYPAIDTVFAFH